MSTSQDRHPIFRGPLFWELLGPKLESSGSCTNCGNVMPLFSVWSSVVLGNITFYFDTNTKYF